MTPCDQPDVEKVNSSDRRPFFLPVHTVFQDFLRTDNYISDNAHSLIYP